MASRALVFRARQLYKEVSRREEEDKDGSADGKSSSTTSAKTIQIQLSQKQQATLLDAQLTASLQNYGFHDRLRGCFDGTATRIQSEDDLKQAIKKAEFVKAEIEALIFLKKYRQMRQRYGVSSDAT